MTVKMPPSAPYRALACVQESPLAPKLAFASIKITTNTCTPFYDGVCDWHSRMIRDKAEHRKGGPMASERDQGTAAAGRLRGKVALTTGASRGIGRGIAL